MERVEALEEAIQKQNLVGIYSVFYTIAHGDPAFSSGKFDEALDYVKSKQIPGFLQEFDGDEFEPEENWNEEYWAFLASALIDNFCETRIAHLKQVGQKIYPSKPRRVQPHVENRGKDMEQVRRRRTTSHFTKEEKSGRRKKEKQPLETETRKRGKFLEKLFTKKNLGGKE